MIAINKIIPFTCEVFDFNNNSLGFLNEYEFNDLRIQISKEKINGYYMRFNNICIPILEDGKLELWPNGFYDIIENQLAILFKFR